MMYFSQDLYLFLWGLAVEHYFKLSDLIFRKNIAPRIRLSHCLLWRHSYFYGPQGHARNFPLDRQLRLPVLLTNISPGRYDRVGLDTLSGKLVRHIERDAGRNKVS